MLPGTATYARGRHPRAKVHAIPPQDPFIEQAHAGGREAVRAACGTIVSASAKFSANPSKLHSRGQGYLARCRECFK